MLAGRKSSPPAFGPLLAFGHHRWQRGLYLNRNKIAVRASDVEPSSADIILESRKIKYFPQRSEGEHLAWLELQPVVIRDLPPAGAFCIPITEAVIPVHR